MSTSDDSSSSLSSPETNANPTREYYEEVGYQTLDLFKRKAPKTKPPPKPVIKEPSPAPIDPIQKLNERLNRQFRPDLVCHISESHTNEMSEDFRSDFSV